VQTWRCDQKNWCTEQKLTRERKMTQGKTPGNTQTWFTKRNSLIQNIRT
jgi:hypothetical protein